MLIINNIRCPSVSKKHSYESVRSILSRKRAESRPKVSDTLDLLGKILENKSFLRATVESTNKKKALIFTTEKLLQGIGNANELFMDGTFSVSLLFKFLYVFTYWFLQIF